MKIYCRIGESLRRHVDMEVRRPGVTITAVFEGAIEHADANSEDFKDLLGSRFHRKKGRRLPGPAVAIGTVVSAEHHERLTVLRSEHKRFVSDVIETALVLYLRQREEVSQARLGLEEFLRPAIVLPKLPWLKGFEAPRPGFSLASIPAGSHVLLDSSVLFASILSIAGESGARAWSEESRNLLERCRTQEVRGMIIPQTVVEVLARLSSEAPAEAAGLIPRLRKLCRSRLEILDVGREDLEAALGQAPERVVWEGQAELALAAARRRTAYALVVATVTDNFDRLAAAEPDGGVRVHKPADLAEPVPAATRGRLPTLQTGTKLIP